MIRIGKSIKKLVKWGLVLLLLALVYRYNPYQIEFLGHYNKIWAHRVNTTQKLDLAQPFFNGVELDLVFMPQTGFLDVTHPPTASIGLNLKTYLTAINKPEKLELWLDIKNLEAQNASKILDRINSLSQNYKIPKSHIIVESRDPNALPIFAALGYKTSYYLPQDLSNPKALSQYNKLLRIENIVKANPGLAVSTHFKDYPLIAATLPKTTKYIWTNRHSRFKDYNAIRTLLKDSTVKVVLIRYKALWGNR